MKQPSFAPAYAAFFPHLAEIAQRNGYALAVHGSLQSDLDLLAAPWTEAAEPPEVLMAQIRDFATGVMAHLFGAESVVHGPEPKPHGRVAWSLSVGNGAVIDLSVMPRIEKEKQDE